jgi:3-hydroxyanthranilate 3,4-dioxygenase
MESAMSISAPFDLMKWIEDRRETMRPSAALWQDGDLILQVIGGPSSRSDYHVDAYEEVFYQLKGDVVIRVIEDGKRRDILLREGEIFLLPPLVPHSPQRPVGSLGLVFERSRDKGVMDAFEWFCDACDTKIFRREVPLKNIVDDLPVVFAEFNGDPKLRTCPACGKIANPTNYGRKLESV